jgi:phosphatidylserine decarboxylase
MHPSGALSFMLTNFLPRRAATRLVGRVSRSEHPVIRDVSIAIFRLLCSPDLSEARHRRFASLRDCFIRELAPGCRPVDPDPAILTSPCDALVMAAGRVEDGMLLQVKGSSYPLRELLRDPILSEGYLHGTYATLRLSAGMYHRFHAPHDCRAERVTHIAGDVWNVNPATVARLRRVYCRNERAVVRLRLERGGHRVTLVPVAAILVAGIRMNFAELPDDRDHAEPLSVACNSRFAKGGEMGWFEHGSTIVVLAPRGFELCGAVRAGAEISMGRPLMRLPS